MDRTPTSRSKGNVVVLEVDEQSGTNTPVFEGPEEEALAYIEQRRSVGKDFLAPGLVVAAGAPLVLTAVLVRSGRGPYGP